MLVRGLASERCDSIEAIIRDCLQETLDHSRRAEAYIQIILGRSSRIIQLVVPVSWFSDVGSKLGIEAFGEPITKKKDYYRVSLIEFLERIEKAKLIGLAPTVQ